MHWQNSRCDVCTGRPGLASAQVRLCGQTAHIHVPHVLRYLGDDFDDDDDLLDLLDRYQYIIRGRAYFSEDPYLGLFGGLAPLIGTF